MNDQSNFESSSAVDLPINTSTSTQSSSSSPVPTISPPSSPLHDKTTRSVLHDLYKTTCSSKSTATIRHANGKDSQLLFVPVCNTIKSFKRVGKDSLITYVKSMSNKNRSFEHNNQVVNEPMAATWLIQSLKNLYPSSFECVTGPGPQLDVHQTAALLEYTNMSYLLNLVDKPKTKGMV